MTVLRACHHLSYPGQQAILDEFAAGIIGVETTAYRLIKEAKEQFPAVKIARQEEAYGRATRARELKEMAENEKAAGPTFVDYTPAGRPLNEPTPLLAGSLVATVAGPAAAASTATAPVVADAVTEVAEQPQTAGKTDPEDETNDSGQDDDDSDWAVGGANEEEKMPDSDD